MGYKQAIEYYRSELDRAVAAGNRNGAMLSAIAYVKTLRQMAEELTSYLQRAAVRREAEKFEYIAAWIMKEGLTDRVGRMLRGEIDPLASEKPKGSPKEAPKATAKAAPKEPPKAAPKESPLSGGIGGVLPLMDPPAAPARPVSAPPPAAAQAPDRPAEPPQNDVPLLSGEDWQADLFEKYLPATVVIHADCSAGTGFFISSEGYLLTNHHVVYEGGSPCDDISFVSGDEELYGAAELVDADKTLDVALLRIKKKTKKPIPVIPLAASDFKIRVGSSCMIIGNAFDHGLAPVAGIVKFPDSHKGSELVYSALTNSGDSGSPLLNRRGECIAIHRARQEEGGGSKARGIAFATPVERIHALLREWSEKHGLKL